jgi:hypothetical protein
MANNFEDTNTTPTPTNPSMHHNSSWIVSYCNVTKGERKITYNCLSSGTKIGFFESEGIHHVYINERYAAEEGYCYRTAYLKPISKDVKAELRILGTRGLGFRSLPGKAVRFEKIERRIFIRKFIRLMKINEENHDSGFCEILIK